MSTPLENFRPLQVDGAFCHAPKSENPAWGEAGLSDGVKLGDFIDKTRRRQNGSKRKMHVLPHLAQEVGNPAEPLLAFSPSMGSKPRHFMASWHEISSAPPRFRMRPQQNCSHAQKEFRHGEDDEDPVD
ncbi:MAG: hypothetical protein EKK33_29230 [Bradyrhizobiaceae bacterium]|nr:MAG: hypothetical protein EKK33_29230 [Bradyrhizobiaceae bacterium]